MKFSYAMLVTSMIVLSIAGCKPSAPPPDLVKTQREALEKAKAVEGQVQQQADEQRKAIDDAEK